MSAAPGPIRATDETEVNAGAQNVPPVANAGDDLVHERGGVLAAAQEVESDLVKEIREQIRNGEYLTEEKLNIAIARLLKEILG